MTIDEMFNELEDKARDIFIVTLKYKYDFEEDYTIENQILDYNSIDDSYVWLNDWYEGQTDIEVLGYMLLGDVDTTKLLTCEDCISREAVRKLIWQDNNKYGYSDRFHEFTQKCLQLPSVTPTSDAFDKIINKIEQTRDKDKIAEYPYNRCIRIVEEYKGGN